MKFFDFKFLEFLLNFWNLLNSKFLIIRIFKILIFRFFFSLLQEDVRPEAEGARQSIREPAKTVDGHEEGWEKWQAGGGGDEDAHGGQAEQTAEGQEGRLLGHHRGRRFVGIFGLFIKIKKIGKFF